MRRNRRIITQKFHSRQSPAMNKLEQIEVAFISDFTLIWSRIKKSIGQRIIGFEKILQLLIGFYISGFNNG